MAPRSQRSRRRGNALISVFFLTMLVTVGAVAYVNRATQSLRDSRRMSYEIQSTHLCESGIQSVLRSLWRPFKINQDFDDMDTRTGGATTSSPKASIAGSMPGAGYFSAGVVSESSPDTYTRTVLIRSVGWVDMNGNGQLDGNEPRKTVDVNATYQLARSQVFDYTYFVNNYGWMDGFGPSDLIVNGDVRANGNFNFTNGSPTINGSVYASVNQKLSPPAAGLVNELPVKWSTSTYLSNLGANPRTRPGYQSGVHGAKGSNQYEAWRDVLFDSTGSVVNNRIDGAISGDSRAARHGRERARAARRRLRSSTPALRKKSLCPT